MSVFISFMTTSFFFLLRRASCLEMCPMPFVILYKHWTCYLNLEEICNVCYSSLVTVIFTIIFYEKICVLDPRDKSSMCPWRAFSCELELAITYNPELVSTNGRFRWVQDTGFRLGHPSTSSATAPRRHSPAISEAMVLVNETQCNFCTGGSK